MMKIMKEKNLGIILIWLPFLLSLFFILSYIFFCENRSMYSFSLDLSSLNKILQFPQLSFSIERKFFYQRKTSNKWNPFIAQKEILVPKKVNIKPKFKLYLSAVLQIDNNLACLINGRIYHSGEIIDYIKIIKIFPSGVIFELPTGKKVVLNVGEEIFL